MWVIHYLWWYPNRSWFVNTSTPASGSSRHEFPYMACPIHFRFKVKSDIYLSSCAIRGARRVLTAAVKEGARKIWEEITMKSIFILLCVTASAVNFIKADVYLHMPRGSNDRLNENTANRKNANRVFDSQVCFQNVIILLHRLRKAYKSVVFCQLINVIF